MITTWWKRCCEGLREARFVSPFSFCEFSLAVLVGVGLWCVCLFVCFVLVLPVKILHSISVSHLLRISSS